MEKKRILIAVLLLAAFMVLVPAVAADDSYTSVAEDPVEEEIEEEIDSVPETSDDEPEAEDEPEVKEEPTFVEGPAIGNTGIIYVSCNVPSATVKINGTVVGTTDMYNPVDFTCQAGQNTVVVSKSGYSTYTTTVAASLNEPGNVVAELTKLDGYLYVESSPSGTVYIDGENYGQSPISVTLSAGSYTVRIVESGYETYTTTVKIVAGEHTKIYPTLSPEMADGYLYIESSPSGTVYIDGEYYGLSPVSATLSPGYYSVRIVKSGYDTFSKSVTVTEGKTTKIYPTLSPETTYGYISINSIPSTANVYIDDSFKGKTPLTVTVPVGSHTVRVVKSGYNDFTTKTYVYEEKTNTISAGLTQEITSAYVLVGSSPSGASVYIDGEFIGATPSTGTLSCTVTANTTHNLAVKESGYETYSVPFSLATGETKLFNPTLTAIKPANGYLSVISVPAGAAVYIDTAYAGTTPLTQSVDAGTHTIMLSCLGYNDYTTTVTVAASQTVPVQATMTPASTPAKSPFPVLGILAGLGIAGLVVLRRK